MKYQFAWTNSKGPTDSLVFAKDLEVQKKYVEKKVQEQVDATVDELIRKSFDEDDHPVIPKKTKAKEVVPIRKQVHVEHQVQDQTNVVQIIVCLVCALLFYFCISLMRRVQTLENLVAWQQTVSTMK